MPPALSDKSGSENLVHVGSTNTNYPHLHIKSMEVNIWELLVWVELQPRKGRVLWKVFFSQTDLHAQPTCISTFQ